MQVGALFSNFGCASRGVELGAQVAFFGCAAAPPALLETQVPRFTTYTLYLLDTILGDLGLGLAAFIDGSLFCCSRQDKTAILGEISPIFRSFSAYFPPMVPHPPFLSPHVYGIRLFPPIFFYFPPIFRLNGTPSLL